MLQLTPLALAPLGVGALGVYPLGVTGEVVKRWVANFDGVDDRGQLQTVINLEGRSFVLAFTCTNNSTVGTFNRIIGNTLNDDFRIYMGSGHVYLTLKTTRRDGSDSFRALSVTPPQVGETVRYTSVFTLTATDTYTVTTTRVNLSTKEEIVQVSTGINTRAILINHVGQALSGASWNGQIYDVVIDGTLWPISEKDYAVQLPAPSGLGEELITKALYETPLIKSANWIKVGDTWTIDGPSVQTSDALVFISSVTTPSSGLLEFEIVSITGSLSCTQNLAAGSVFNTVGKKRFFYTNYSQIGSVAWRFRIPTAGALSCVIKNISFKPLGTCNPLTLTNMTNANWQEIEV